MPRESEGSPTFRCRVCGREEEQVEGRGRPREYCRETPDGDPSPCGEVWRTMERLRPMFDTIADYATAPAWTALRSETYQLTNMRAVNRGTGKGAGAQQSLGLKPASKRRK